VAAVLLGCGHAASARLDAGDEAPSLAVLQAARGHPVLVTFLDAQAQPSVAGNPSRSQVVFVKSMDTQSRRFGLRTVLVDGSKATPNELVNYGYDWALPRSISVLGDADGSLARVFGVTRLPTTFLTDRRGTIVRRWDRLAQAAQLDFAIRRLTGRTPFSP
jgi:hypothetical protein